MGRGLFRLWMVATILWAVFLLFVSAYDSRPNALEIYFEAALVPPAVILIIGLMLRWAFKGFPRHH
jgi:hypothetical protein